MQEKPLLNPVYIDYEQHSTLSQKQKKQEHISFRKALIYMNIYIAFNLAYNVGAKFLQQPKFGYSAFEVGFYRSFVGIFILVLIMRYNSVSIEKSVPREQHRWVYFRAFIGVFYFTSYTFCIGQGAISTVFLSQNISPMISSIAAFYLFNEHLNRLDVVSLIAGFFGIILVTFPYNDDDDLDYENETILSTILTISLPFQLSALQLSIKQMKQVHFSIINFYYVLFTSIALGIVILIQYVQSEDLSHYCVKSVALAVITGSTHVFAIIFYTLAFQQSKVGKVALIAYSQLVYSMLTDYLIFGMTFSWLQLVGMSIVQNLNSNLEDYTQSLIEQERSKFTSLNHSRNPLLLIQIGDLESSYMRDGTKQEEEYGYQAALTKQLFQQRKIVRVFVDSGIQFDIEIQSNLLTCGWLISEVSRLYKDYLKKLSQNPNFGIQLSKSNSILAQNQRYFTSPSQHSKDKKTKDAKRVAKKLIVALKTIDQSEGLDYWLTLYDRRLFPLRQNEILMCHFAKLAQNKQKVISKGDFEMLKVIGKGGFSRVILSRKKDTGRLYAIKIMKKSKIIKEKKVRPILSERSVLESIDHPFIIKLHWAFQTKQELFFVLDLCTGGEIFFHLNNMKYFSEQVAKFYFSEVLLGLEYLHDRNVVFRDLKPENILLDIDGHVKIADFGLAKVIPEKQKSYSFCGSPEYMSPEMLTGKGHDRQLDYYCLGAFLYEMLCGLPPFYNKSTEKMYSNILREKLTFPESFNMYPLVKDLLRKLMDKNLEKRFKSVREIRAHPWFSDVNWVDLMQKKVQPPFIPSVYDSNFDSAYQDLPVDFEEVQNPRSRFSTERRQSYYIESSIQSRKITEHSYFLEKGNLQFDTDHGYDLSQSINQTQLNNFFNNPHEESNIINQSAIHKPANNQGQILDTSNNSQVINLSENTSSFRQGNHQNDEFQNFSFYDSPYEESQILDSIKNCCVIIASLPETLCKAISNPLDNQEMSYHLENISSHMKKWQRSSKKTIQEELGEETPIQNQKNLKIREIDTPIQQFTSQLSTERKKEEKKTNKHSNKIKKRIKTPVAKYKEPSKILQVEQISNFNDWNKAISRGEKETAEEQTDKCEFHSNFIKSISRECNSSHFESSHNSIAEEMKSNESIELNQYNLEAIGEGYKTQQVKKNLYSLDFQNPEQPALFQGLKHNFMKSVVGPELKVVKSNQKLLDQTEYGLSSPIKVELTSHRTASLVPKAHTEESRDQKQDSSRKQKQSVDQVFERAKQNIKPKEELIQTKKFQEFFNAHKQKETNNPKKSRNHEYGYVSQTPEFQFYSTCQPATLEHLQSLKGRNQKIQPVKAQLQMTQKLEPKMSKQIHVLAQNSDRVYSSTKTANLNIKILDEQSKSRSPSGLRSEGKNQKIYKSYIYESDPVYGVKKLALKKKRSPTNSPQRIFLLEKALKLNSNKKEQSHKVMMSKKLINISKQGLSTKNKIEISPVSVKGKTSCEPSKKSNRLQIGKFNSHKMNAKKPQMQLSKVNLKTAQSPLIFKNHMQKSVPLIESFKSALTKQKSEMVQFQPISQEQQNHFQVNSKDIFNWKNVQNNISKNGQDIADAQLKCIKANSAQLLKTNGQKQQESRVSRNRDQVTGVGQMGSKKVLYSLSTQSVQNKLKPKK